MAEDTPPNDLLPACFFESLPELRRRRDAEKAIADRAARNHAHLAGLVEHLESCLDTESVSVAPPTLAIEPGEFSGLSVPQSMMKVFLANRRPMRAREMTAALVRGGQAPDREKIRSNVGFYFKRWRAAKKIIAGPRDPDGAYPWVPTAEAFTEFERVIYGDPRRYVVTPNAEPSDTASVLPEGTA